MCSLKGEAFDGNLVKSGAIKTHEYST